ncbi:MAG: C25 family cysteine peptidase [Bacteroidales bacterium]|nr:C25 family cysteine peptidase [Bacteroidales bacterium]
MCLGKHKQGILIACFLLLLAPVYSQAGKSHKYRIDGDLKQNSVIATNHSLTINYSISEINIENQTNENGTYYRVSIPGHTPTCEPGRPELPVLSRLISVPEGFSYRIKISDVISSKIRPAGEKIEGILFPAQEGETKEPQNKKPQFVIDKAIYSARRLLRSDTVKIEPLGTVRKKNLASLLITPARYNPKTNSLEVITSMKIEVIFSMGYGTGSKTLFPESKSFGESLSKGLLNYNPDDMITGYSEQPVKMVIITDTTFRKHLEPFLRWKTQKGYKLNVLYKGAGLAGNTYTELKDTLTSIYNASSESNPPPEYLLIIGDVDKVPYYGSGNVTDMYYGEFDGNGDYIPEMFIGRLPVADTTELKSVVQKILQYEKFEFADTNKFYSNGLITAGYDPNYGSYMNGQIKYAISNYLTPANKIKEYHFNYPQTQPAHEDSVKKIVNKGVSFINYTGHGSAVGWLGLNIDTSDVRKLINVNKYPFVISNSCQTSSFNLPSLGNKMVVSNDKGAIGFIGCSNDSYWNEDFYWAVGVCTPSEDPTYETTGPGFYDRLFHTHGEPASDWYFTMGQINYAGNLAVSASTSSRKKYYWETYNLVGDPSVIPIIGTPDSFSIVLPDILPNNIKSYSFTTTPFSYAAISHFDTLWDASYVSPSGSVTLNIPEIEKDSCLIVITGQNKVPIIKTIYFSDINEEFINLTRTGINDSSENNNGLADFGETLFLNLTISNLGLTNAKHVYAKILSASEWVTINTDSVTIGTLSSGAEIVLYDDLSITIAQNVPDKGIITLDLILKDDAGEKLYKIDICVHAPLLEILSYQMDDSKTGNSNSIADAGETLTLIFRIQNQGSSSTSGQLSISSPNEEITVLEPTKNSGILEIGETVEIPVLVNLSETVSSGTTISIMTFLDCNPYFVNREFSFRVGRIRESFESASFQIFSWINISSKPWIITGTGPYDGTFSARSGIISHNESSALRIRTEYPAADSLRFFYKVSSENNYDFLIFKLNGTEVLRKSGETLWEEKVIFVPAGFNDMEWIYKKDQSVSNGADCAFLDMIDFAGSGSVRYIQRDIEVARIVSPSQKDQLGKEPVIVKVFNQGPDTINGFYLAYTINNSIPVRQYFSNSLVPFGDSVDVTFSSEADLSLYGNYDIVTYSYDNNDDYIFNDTLQINIKNTDIEEPLLVFPNPFTDVLNIVIISKIQGTAYISLTNPAGKKISNFETPIIEGMNEIFIKDNRLVPSVYYLRVEYPGNSRTIPVIKTRK